MDEDRFACCGGDGNAYLLQPVKAREDERTPIHLGKIRDPMVMRTLKFVFPAMCYILHLILVKINAIRGHTDEVNIVVFNPSKTRLATGSDDFTTRVWDVAGRSERMPPNIKGSVLEQQTDCLVLKGHTKAICSVKWCPKLVEGCNELIAT